MTRPHLEDIPDVLDDPEVQHVFEEFIKMRISIRKKPTSYAITLLIERLNTLAGNDAALAVAILNQSIVNNYLGLFPPKGEHSYSVRSHMEANIKAKKL